MKKRTTTVIIILMIVTGLSLLLYPTLSNYLRDLAFRRTIAQHTATAQRLDETSLEEELSAARAYNQRRAAKGGYMIILSEEERAEYSGLLDIDNTGVMGYVSVPKVNISLPIYHGTSDGALQSGVGHLESSSLPVGGPSTHAVLSAHTGLPTAKLFSNINRLEEGDTFAVWTLGETLTYQVDQIQVVPGSQMNTLRIEPGEDYCTLVTCTPYGVNSHRLLVRGHRVPTPSAAEALPDVEDETQRPGGAWWLPVTVTVLVLAAALAVLYRQKSRKKRAKRPKEKETTIQNLRDPERPGAG